MTHVTVVFALLHIYDGITDSMDMGWVKLRELVIDGEAWRAVIHGVTKSRARLSNLTQMN